MTTKKPMPPWLKDKVTGASGTKKKPGPTPGTAAAKKGSTKGGKASPKKK